MSKPDPIFEAIKRPCVYIPFIAFTFNLIAAPMALEGTKDGLSITAMLVVLMGHFVLLFTLVPAMVRTVQKSFDSMHYVCVGITLAFGLLINIMAWFLPRPEGREMPGTVAIVASSVTGLAILWFCVQVVRERHGKQASSAAAVSASAD